MGNKGKWILIHLGKEEKISYDFSSGKYYRYSEKDISKDILAWKMFRPGKYYGYLAGNIVWILLYPLLLIAMEAGHESLQNIPPSDRRTGTIILFAVGICLCSGMCEAFSLKSIRDLKKRAKEVERPDPNTKVKWNKECADRLKTVRKWQMYCWIPFAGFLIVYLCTNWSIAQTLSLACYMFGYMLTTMARPGLLKKYVQIHSGSDTDTNR